MAAAPFAIAGVQAYQQYDQANKLASAQKKAQKIKNAQMVDQVTANYDELADVEREAQEQSVERALDVQKGYIKNKGRINVMAAAMGTGGMSMQSQLKDLEREKFSDFNTVLEDRQAGIDNIASQAQSMRYSAAAGMSVQAISRPSNASLALNLGTTAIQGYNAQQKQNAQSAQLATGV